MSKTREGREFAQPTKNALMKRANYLCSNPACRRATLSPSGSDPTGSLLVGEAAHIGGAGDGSARYDPGQSDVECRSIANGIWLCVGCSTLVDKNGGADYPVETLRGWKGQHESWVKRGCPRGETPTVVSGTHVARGTGKVTGLDIRKAVIIQPGTMAMAEGDGEVTGTRVGGE